MGWSQNTDDGASFTFVKKEDRDGGDASNMASKFASKAMRGEISMADGQIAAIALPRHLHYRRRRRSHRRAIRCLRIRRLILLPVMCLLLRLCWLRVLRRSHRRARA